jgi:hypothetical protein
MPNNPQLDDLLKDVEKDNNGRPIAVSRYGWKKQEINGKKYMMAMTKEEADNFVARVLTKEQLEAMDGYCVNCTANCLQGSCTGICRGVIDDGYVCTCNLK